MYHLCNLSGGASELDAVKLKQIYTSTLSIVT